MKVFFDSSAFVKRFVEEIGSAEIEMISQQATMVGLSIICLPEILSALNRKVCENNLSCAEYKQLKSAIVEDIADIQIINLLPDVIEKSILLLELNPLRSLDSLHIACALVWQAELFVSADKRQIQAAENAGLQVRYVG